MRNKLHGKYKNNICLTDYHGLHMGSLSSIFSTSISSSSSVGTIGWVLAIPTVGIGPVTIGSVSRVSGLPVKHGTDWGSVTVSLLPTWLTKTSLPTRQGASTLIALPPQYGCTVRGDKLPPRGCGEHPVPLPPGLTGTRSFAVFSRLVRVGETIGESGGELPAFWPPTWNRNRGLE